MKMNKLLIALVLVASNSFAGFYGDHGAPELDQLNDRLRQQDTEDRLNALESKQKSTPEQDLESFEKAINH
jgi:hypothetical protein